MTGRTTETEVFDHHEIEASNVVERYLLGKLSAPEVAAFEDHFFDCEECLEKLELSRMLHQGMQEVVAQEATKAWAGNAVLAWLARRGAAARGLMVMGLLTLMVLPWALLLPEVSRGRLDNRRLTETVSRALSPQPHRASVLLSPERSGLDDAPSTLIRVGDDPEWVTLALQLPPRNATGRFRVRLLDEGNSLLWQSAAVAAEPPGQLAVSVHSSWLQTSIYHLDVAMADAAQDTPPLVRFSFQAKHMDTSSIEQ